MGIPVYRFTKKLEIKDLPFVSYICVNNNFSVFVCMDTPSHTQI